MIPAQLPAGFRSISLNEMIKFERKNSGSHLHRSLPQDILEIEIRGRSVGKMLEAAKRSLYRRGHYTAVSIGDAFGNLYALNKDSPKLRARIDYAAKVLQYYLEPGIKERPSNPKHLESIRHIFELAHRDLATYKALWSGLTTPRYTSITHPEKLVRLDDELAQFMSAGTRLADVGCAVDHGAPTTMDTKARFNAIVKAFDVHEAQPEVEQALAENGIKYSRHIIARAPLKEKFHVIRVANVLCYLPSSLVGRAIRNILESLDGGTGIVQTERAMYLIRNEGEKRRIYIKDIRRKSPLHATYE